MTISRRISAKDAQALLGKKPAHKYGAKTTTVDEIKFASKAEADRWSLLRVKERAGLISDLRRQVRFALNVNGDLVCYYIADFVFYDEAANFVVEDSKGFRTQSYIIKRKLMKAVHGIDIVEVGGRKPRAKSGDWIARKASLRSAA